MIAEKRKLYFVPYPDTSKTKLTVFGQVQRVHVFSRSCFP